MKGRGGVLFFDSTIRRRHMADTAVSHSRSDSNHSSEAFSAEILASPSSVAGVSTPTSELCCGSIKPLDEEMMHSLLRRYPKGNLWSLDDATTGTSEDEEEVQTTAYGLIAKRKSSRSRKSGEEAMLRKHFSGVSQVMFCGLWDVGSS